VGSFLILARDFISDTKIGPALDIKKATAFNLIKLPQDGLINLNAGPTIKYLIFGASSSRYLSDCAV